MHALPLNQPINQSIEFSLVAHSRVRKFHDNLISIVRSFSFMKPTLWEMIDHGYHDLCYCWYQNCCWVEQTSEKLAPLKRVDPFKANKKTNIYTFPSNRPNWFIKEDHYINYLSSESGVLFDTTDWFRCRRFSFKIPKIIQTFHFVQFNIIATLHCRCKCFIFQT